MLLIILQEKKDVDKTLRQNERLEKARIALSLACKQNGLSEQPLRTGVRSPGAYVVSLWQELMTFIRTAMGAQQWCAIVGLPQIGWMAVHEAGVDLSRVVTVPRVNDNAAIAIGLLLDSCAITVVGEVDIVPRHQRDLAAKARSRKSFLISTKPWSGARRCKYDSMLQDDREKSYAFIS